MSLALEHLGLKYIPFTHGGVPEVSKESRPVGLERELKELIDAVNLVLSQKLNENLVIVVVGEYGWGKTELLDYFTKVVESKYGDKVEIARVPLTFSLSTRHIVSILKKRDASKPLILIIDEADELTRAIALKELAGNGREVEKAILELSTTIRALVEPRQYYRVLGVELEKLKNILIIVALTPQTYYGILKNIVPDIFDISIGRIYKEIPLPSGISLWVADGIVQEKLKAASTQKRLREVKRGSIDPRHPLCLEYIASLYYILYLAEKGPPSPRIFVKYIAKLFDEILKCSGKLTLDVYIRFLKAVSNELPIVKEILQRIDSLREMYENDDLARLHVLLEIVPIPVTREFLVTQLGSEVDSLLKALEKMNIVRRVVVLKTSLEKLNLVNELREKAGLAPLSKDDVNLVGIAVDEYYVEYRDGLAILNVVLPTLGEVQDRGLGERVEAYVPVARSVLSVTSDSSESKIRQCIRAAYEKISKPIEAAQLLVEALIGKPKIVHRLRENVFALSCGADTLELRQCVLFFHVQNIDELKQVENVVNDVILNACVRVGSDEILYDVLHVVLYSQNLKIPRDFVDKLLQGEWKLPEISRRDYLNIIVLDSESIERFRKALAGYLILRQLGEDKVPDKYVHLVKAYEDLRAQIANFLTKAREETLKELCIGIRKSRESKANILKELVRQWISGTVSSETPDVFKSPDGRPRISRPEQLLHKYLLERGIEQISQRELERVIRRLFPVHLWRELREKDLIELCKLRAILLPVNAHLRVYTPEVARDYLMNKLRELKSQLSRARAELEISIGNVKKKIAVQIVPTELEQCIKALEQEIVKELIGLSLDEDSLRKVSKIILELDDIKNKLTTAISTGDTTLRKLRETMNNLNIAYNNVRERLSTLSKTLPKLAEWFSKKLESEISIITNALDVEEAPSLDYISEILSKVADRIVEIQLEVEKILGVLGELEKLKREAAHVVKGIEKEIERALKDVDKKSALTREPASTALKYLQALLTQLRAKVSDKLAALYRELEKIASLKNILCKLKLLEDEKICKDSISLENIEHAKTVIFSRLGDISRQIRFSTEKLAELLLSLSTPRDVEELSNMLNIEKDSLVKILERLHEIGIVKKLYCI